MIELKHLSPLELLEFLKSIKSWKDIELSCLNKYIEKEWLGFEVIINKHMFQMYLPYNWYEKIGATYYYKTSEEALDVLTKLVIDRLYHFLEAVYYEWIKNDTGYNISDEFKAELIDELDRIDTI